MLSHIKQYIFFLFLSSNLFAMELVIDNLNIVTFTPVQPVQELDNCIKDSFEPIGIALKGGRKLELVDARLQLSNKYFALSCSLPENHAGTIYLNVPPLICNCDKRAYPERGAYEVYSLFKSGVIEQGIGVSYCSPNHRRDTFNFGQDDDQRIISMLINEIVKKNPVAKIVLMGICAGATGIVNTLAGSELSFQAQQNIDAVILQSPAISSDKVWQDMGSNYLPYGLKWLFPIAAPFYFVNCKPCDSQQEILDSYDNIPSHIGFMIGKLRKDPVTPTESVREVENALTTHNNSVTVFECTDSKIRHGFLAPHKGYQEQIKQFLIERKLDHV
jgi:hypothetical protein